MDAHRGAFEYDWRVRFHKPLTCVGRGMSWGEAVRLTRILSGDPSSQIAAALAGWSHPLSRLDVTLRDLYDLTHRIGAAGSKSTPRPYPRPWEARPQRLTDAEMAEARAALERARAQAREAADTKEA